MTLLLALLWNLLGGVAFDRSLAPVSSQAVQDVMDAAQAFVSQYDAMVSENAKPGASETQSVPPAADGGNPAQSGDDAPSWSYRTKIPQGESPVAWKDPELEAIARRLSGIEQGSIFPSDLDFVTELQIREADGGYSIFTNSLNTWTSRQTTGGIRTLSDLTAFRNVTVLWVDAPQVKDLSPLAQMTQLRSLMLKVNERFSDLSPLAYLENLEWLMMWGAFYPKVKDLSPLAGLQNLRTAMVIFPSATDVSVFTDLPKLNELTLIVSDAADIGPLLDCAHIESLTVNAVTYR